MAVATCPLQNAWVRVLVFLEQPHEHVGVDILIGDDAWGVTGASCFGRMMLRMGGGGGWAVCLCFGQMMLRLGGGGGWGGGG